MTDKPIPFPVRPDQTFTFEQAVSTAENRQPVLGLIAGYDEDGDIMIFSFGGVSRKDALWISEQIKRHAFGEELS